MERNTASCRLRGLCAVLCGIPCTHRFCQSGLSSSPAQSSSHSSGRVRLYITRPFSRCSPVRCDGTHKQTILRFYATIKILSLSLLLLLIPVVETHSSLKKFNGTVTLHTHT